VLAFACVTVWAASAVRFASWRRTRSGAIDGLKDLRLWLYLKGTGLLLLAALIAICVALTDS
jgi:hypothetical protein